MLKNNLKWQYLFQNFEENKYQIKNKVGLFKGVMLEPLIN